MASAKKRRNGFYYFMLQIKEEQKKDGKFLPMKEIVPIAGPRWDQLSDSEKASYKERARTEKALELQRGSALSQMELQQGSGSPSSGKRDERTGKRKRRTTGFFLYMKDIQAELELEAGTFLYLDEIAELAGPRWSQLSPEVKESYKARARIETAETLSGVAHAKARTN